jgi:phage-related minor tail protein|nr:MAG TPA: minor tail protein [Caudoviricetes sp.]
MAGSIKGITVEIGGDTTGLSKALAGINKNITSTQKQLKEVEKLLKLDPKNTELLEQKQRLLGDAIEQTSTKLDALKQAEAEAQKQFQKGDLSREEYEKLQRQIIATEQKLQGLTTQTSKTKKAFDNISKSSEDFAGKLDSLSGKLAPITAGVLGLGAAAIGAVEGTEELRSDLSKLDQNAKEHKVSIDTARKAWEDFAIASDETDSAVEATSNLLQAGFTESNLQKAVENLTGAYLRFPDTMKIESLADSLQETLATGAATGQFAELLDRLGIGAEKFSKGLAKCKTQADKQNYALETLSKAGLADTYNGWKDTNSELVESKKANLDLQKSMAKLAETVQPILTDIVDAVSDMVDWFNELSPEVKETTVKVLAFSAALSPIAKIASSVTKGISSATKGISKMIKPAMDATSNTGLLSKAMSTLSGIPGIGMIGTIGGITVALTGLIVGLLNAEKTTNEYVRAVQESAEKSREAIAAAQESAQSTINNANAQAVILQKVLDLNNAEDLNAEKKETLAGLVDQLNSKYPDLNLKIGENGRLTKDSAQSLEDYIKNLKDMALAQASYDLLTAKAEALVKAEQDLKKAKDEHAAAQAEENKIRERALELTGKDVEELQNLYEKYGNLNMLSPEVRDEALKLTLAFGTQLQEVSATGDAVETAQDQVDEFGTVFNSTADSIGVDSSEISKASTSGFGEVGTAANEMKREVGNGADGTETEVSDMATNINDTLNSIDGNKVGTNLATGMSNGIKNNSWKVSDEAKKMMQGVEDAINANPKFKSLAKSVGIQGFADGGTLTSGLAVVGEEGPEWLSVQSGRATVIPMTTRQRQAVQGSGGNTVHVGITINNGQFTASDAKRVARMVNRELGMVYR